MLTTPDTIRTLQRKLYAKAKQEPAYRFYALYDKLYRADILSHAWRLVKANKGSPGVDGISFEAIENGEGIETFLRELAQDLKHKTAYFGDRDQRFRLIVNKRGSGCAKREFIGLCSRSLRNLMSEVIHGRARGYPHGA